MKMRYLARAAGVLLFVVPVPMAAAQEARVAVEKVSFPSRDGKTNITGYVFKSAAAPDKAPAIVMVHGRSGAYSSRAGGTYEAGTLSGRHKSWGRLLARQGYIVVLVDDYGSLGFPGGIARAEMKNRPAALDDISGRPLHAYGALRYLRMRSAVDGARVGLIGWSNGGSTTLAAMADDKPGDMRKLGFEAAAALYPSCALKKRYTKSPYEPYAAVRIFIGSADKSVSPQLCQELVDRSRRRKGDIALTVYPGATHSFDVPTSTFQKVPENVAARAAAQKDVLAFFAERLKAD